MARRWAARINDLAGTYRDAAGGIAMLADQLVIGHADGEVVCVDLATGDTIWTGSERHEEPLQVVTSSPDGRWAATSASDHVIRVWDVAAGAMIARFDHTHTAYDVRFSPDGERLATACTDETVGVYRLGNDQRITIGKGHDSWVTAVDWSPRGDRLVSVSLDATVRLWNATTGLDLIRRELVARSEAVAWSPRDHIAVGLEDGSVSLIDASGPLIEVARPRTNAGQIHCLRWAAGGRLLAAGCMEAVVVWDDYGTRELARFELDAYAYRIAWSPDATILGASLCGDRVRLWDVPV